MPLGAISLAVDAPALVGWGQSHRLAVLGDRASRNRNSLARENLGDATVAQWRRRILLADQLANLGANGGRGGARTIVAFHLARKEIAQLEHAARRVHVLARSDARDG